MPIVTSGVHTEAGSDRINADAFAIGRGTLVIGDGLGGHPAARAIARLAVDCAYRSLRSGEYTTQEAIQSANEAVISAIGSRTARTGSTLTVAVVEEALVTVGSIGDSRAWIVTSSGNARLLTTDHTAASQAGLAVGDPHYQELSRQLTAYLGRDQTPCSEVTSQKLACGRSWLVLTTDGIHDYMKGSTLGSLVAASPSAPQAAQALVEEARKHGSRDDRTTLVAEVVVS